MDNIHNIFKIILVGDMMVGKSSIFTKYTRNEYSGNNYIPTIGIDFNIKTIKSHGRNIKLQIYDTSGNDRFCNITDTFYKNASGIFIICDKTKIETYHSIGYWIERIRQKDENCKIIIIGNKSDINTNNKYENDINKLIKQHNLQYIEISVKNNINLDYIFEEMIKYIFTDPYLVYNSINDDKNANNKYIISKKESNFSAIKNSICEDTICSCTIL